MKTFGPVLLGLGALIILLGVTADMIGTGAEPDFFGWKQMSLIAVGAVVVLVGLVMLRNSGTDSDDTGADED